MWLVASWRYVFAVLVWCLFFFFKQKTAYEMRISDWSSDVCSSDLLTRDRLLVAHSRGQIVAMSCFTVRKYSVVCPSELSKTSESLLTFSYPQQDAVEKIGRASCRERVCQYV